MLEESTEFIQRNRPSHLEIVQWLNCFWKVVQVIPLERVGSWKIVPVSSRITVFSLMPLSVPMVVSVDDCCLSHESVAALNLLGVQVILSLPSFVQHKDLSNFLYSSYPYDVNKALVKSIISYQCSELISRFNKDCTSELSVAFFKTIDLQTISAELLQLIRRLNLFTELNGRQVSIAECPNIRPGDLKFPIKLPVSLIYPRTTTEHNIAVKMGASVVTESMLCCMVFKTRQHKVSYGDYEVSDEELYLLVSYIFGNSMLRDSKLLREYLLTTAFIKTAGGQMKRPNEVYDVEDEFGDLILNCSELLIAEEYQKIVPFLRGLGMKSVDEMPPEQFISMASSLQLEVKIDIKVKRAVAFLRVLEKREDFRQICETIKELNCVPVITDAPEEYPDSLQWVGREQLCSPSQVKSYSVFKGNLGSVVPLILCDTLPNISGFFGWNICDDSKLFVDHLLNVIDCFVFSDGACLVAIMKIYQKLSQLPVETLDYLKNHQCVLTGHGFKYPSEVFLDILPEDLSLIPFIFPVQECLIKEKDFFFKLGCHKSQSRQLYLSVLSTVQKCKQDSHTITKKNLTVVVDILHKLSRNLCENEQIKLLVPVSANNVEFEMLPIDQCSYLDQGYDWLNAESLNVHIVHQQVGVSLAKSLGVMPLNRHLLAGEESIMEWGQEESLTTRLHNLLNNYRDGVGILKELVQNADDAGAGIVRFLHDERTNAEFKTRLITDNMSECQGPALWAFNDATFTDSDLSNITQLGSGSKLKEKTKIGKFGLGFCSVYNITDLPSFVSGSNYVIFDPHMAYIDNKSKSTGVKYNISKLQNRFMMKMLSGQFGPFKDVFSCDIQESSHYPGTLFRFPLRTPLQAVKSKLCNSSYGPLEMGKLLDMFIDVAGNLLLFTQNVKEIQVFHLPEGYSPQEQKLLFEVKKETLLIDELSDVSRSAVTVNERAADVLYPSTLPCQIFEECYLMNLSVKNKKEMYIVPWMVSWHGGRGLARDFSLKKDITKLPVGAVAVPLQEKEDGWDTLELKELPGGFYQRSHFHCFLPLPIQTALPVHINGSFELSTDRTTLKFWNEDDRCSTEDWNTTLVSDTVSAAYHSMLQALSKLTLSQDYLYYKLWPKVSNLDGSLELELCQAFYAFIFSNESAALFRWHDSWYPMTTCWFFDNQFLKQKEVGRLALKFMRSLRGNDGPVLELPDDYVLSMKNHLAFMYRSLSEEQFYTEYFLTKIVEGAKYVEVDERDFLIAYALDSQKSRIFEIMQITKCISCKMSHELKLASELVDPHCQAAALFETNSDKFPADILTSSDQRLISLRQLGMISDPLPCSWVLERANAVTSNSCSVCAKVLSELLVGYLSGVLVPDQLAEELKSVKFLPVMNKPSNWVATWAGTWLALNLTELCVSHKTFNSVVFSAPKHMCTENLKELLGCSYFVYEGVDNIPDKFLQRIGVLVSEKDIAIDTVITQLEMISGHTSEYDKMRKICFRIYEYLNGCANQNVAKLKQLRAKNILLTKIGFQSPNRFAFSPTVDCPPELFSVSVEGLGHYPCLASALGIKQHIVPSEVLTILKHIGESLKSKLLDENQVLHFSKLLSLYFTEISEVENTETVTSGILIPGSDRLFHEPRTLCIEDGAHLNSTTELLTIHKAVRLSQEEALALGILTKTKKFVHDLSDRIPFSDRVLFGQSESLTGRLKNILKDYPCDSSIMREMLQNADDANASCVIFVKDYQQHPTEKLIDQMWAPLQGPSLCIYNDSCFTEKDLKNIQNLGRSCKIKDSSCIGQYGIGFNVVYHLTDVPSFLTKGSDVPGGKVLCMFDPHCRYDPQTTPDYPGVLFKNLDHLQSTFPDTFHGYHESKLLKSSGTLFRLPLRTSPESKISNAVISKQNLNEIADSFILEMKKSLQFLKNVREMSVMTIHENGEWTTDYEVSCALDAAGHSAQMEIKDWLSSDFANINSTSIPKRVSYEMEIRDSHCHEKWLVVQQMGSSDTVPKSIQDLYNDGEINLFPHGGVAILLEMKKSELLDAKINQKSIFTTCCYLPLSISSGFNLSIHGNFALNSSRRDLWVGESEHPKSKWNYWLFEKVIAPAVADALLQYRKYLFPDNLSKIKKCEYMEKMKRYLSVLPNATAAKSSFWKDGADQIFKDAIKNEYSLFDVCYPVDHNIFCLEWNPLKRTGDSFNMFFEQQKLVVINRQDIVEKISDLNSLPNILKGLKMRIGSSSFCCILKNLQIPVSVITPEIVVDFLMSWNKQEIQDRCFPQVGKPIWETPFCCVDNVNVVLKFIMGAKMLCQNLVGLPILVTNDEILRCFSKEFAVFNNKFWDVAVMCNHEFIHKDLLKQIGGMTNELIAENVVKPFLLQDLAARMTKIVDVMYLASSDDMLPLPCGTVPPGEHWLCKFWKFVKNKLMNSNSNFEAGRNEFLQLFGNWAVYPVTYQNESYLVRLKHAKKVLAITESPFGNFSTLRPKLLPRGHTLCPEDPCQAIGLAASKQDTSDVLEIVFERSFQNEMIFNKNEATELMRYFGSSETTLSRETLRALPFYEDIDGKLVSVNERKMAVLCDESIPLDGLGDLAMAAGYILLKQPKAFECQKLYNYLEANCEKKDLAFYATVILPNFIHLSVDHHLPHLTFLRQRLSYAQNDGSYGIVISHLGHIAFIEHQGELFCAKEFYDSNNPVLRTFCEDWLLPATWASQIWYDFLKLAGLMDKVTMDMFLRFASHIKVYDPLVIEKSKTLVHHLTKHHKDMGQYFITRLSAVEFIALEERPELANILPHFKTKSGLLSLCNGINHEFAEVAWTTCPVLPEYASQLRQSLSLSGFSSSPGLDHVILHLTNLCSSFSADVPSGMHDVMHKVYAFLAKQNMAFLDQLKSIPLVYISEHKTSVTADQTVAALEQEIPPYLYKLPSYFGMHFPLFFKLGASEKVTMNIYATVLCKIYTASKEEALSADEFCRMRLCLKGIIQNCETLPELSKQIFLPTINRKLKKSQELFIADNQGFEDCVGDCEDMAFFPGFSFLDLQMDNCKFVTLLPVKYRPQFISCVITELFDPQCTEEISTPLLVDLLHFWSSPLFIEALLRLVNDHKLIMGSSLSIADKTEILQTVRSFKLKQVTEIRTRLILLDKFLGSRTKSSFLLTSGEGSQCQRVLYLCESCVVQEVALELCSAFIKILKLEHEGRQAMILMAIFDSFGNETKLPKLLDSLNLKKCDMAEINEMVIPTIGFYLEPHFVSHLDNEVHSFKEQEIVFLKKYMDIASSNDIYITVQVKSLHKTGSRPELDEYVILINTRSEQLIVKAHQLYKLKLPQDCHSNVLDICKQSCTATSQSDQKKDVQKAPESDSVLNSHDNLLESIKTQVIEMWKLPDKLERNHCLRRLFILWHPDRNGHRKQMASQVFQLLHSLVNCLERNAQLPTEKLSTDLNENVPGGFCEIFADYYSNWRKQHDPDLEGNPATLHAGQGIKRKMSDKPEGERWAKQARHDLDAARKELVNDGSPCWVMYMCHQATEKMMKSTLFTEDCDRATSFKNHHLESMAASLKQDEVAELVKKIVTHTGYHTRLRYPDEHGVLPCERFQKREAEEVVEVTTEIFRLLHAPVVQDHE